MEIAIEAGAEDIRVEDEYFEVLTELTDYDAVANAIEEAGIQAESSELAYLPNSEVPVEDRDTAKKVLRLVEVLEDLEDVKAVHSNFDIDDSLLED